MLITARQTNLSITYLITPNDCIRIMNLLSKLLLASGLCAAMASDSANLRAGNEQLRQLSETDYSSSSSSSMSGGTYMWYFLLNAVNFIPDAVKGPCEKQCDSKQHRELKHHWWGGDDWAGDDWAGDDWHADGWKGDDWHGDEWKADEHTSSSSSSSSSSKKSGGGSKKKEECPPLPARCQAPHMKKITLPHPTPKPKKTSSKKKSSSTTWHDDAWEGDDWHDDAWKGDDHAAKWDDDGHHWGDDGYYWDDDGHWGDDQWGNDGNSSKNSWLKYNNNSNQSLKSKLLWPLVGVGLLVGVLAAALVARRVS